MNIKLNFNIEKLKNSPNHKIKINELMKFLEFYFVNGRPKKFIKYENELRNLVYELMFEMSLEELLYVIPNYYQFCYTVSIEDDYLLNQKKISEHLLVPFSKTLKKKLNQLNFKPLVYDVFEDRYVIVCRHAVTTGMYAPGSAIYSITSGLLDLGKTIVLITLGNIDHQFVKLQKKNSKLTILKKDDVSTPLKQLINLRVICQKFRPSKIITEMPVNIGVALYYSKITSKVLYWSPGFTHVPWFDKVLLVPELLNENLLKTNKFVEVPKSLNFELINPDVNYKLVKNFKKEKLIEEADFVMGTFSRYEKISESFLELVFNLLKINKNRKIIIAGTNDNSRAKKKLKRFIENKQAIILGFSDVHILGNCCDVFLDTFPFPCGFSAIEIMSKGKPVVSINQPNLSNYKKSRVNKLILENENDLNGCLIKLENNSKFYNEMSEKSIKIAKDYDNSLKLAESIASL